jgi:hypothetical protein
VVWGKEVVKVRDDYVVLQHLLYDQDGVLVKKLETLDVAVMDGKPVAKRQRMFKVETPEEWTEVRMLEIDFGVNIKSNMFTLANLRNPRL